MALVEKFVFGTMQHFSSFGLVHWMLLLICVALFVVLVQVITSPKPSKNPFSTKFVREPQPLVTDHKKRDEVIKEVSNSVQFNSQFTTFTLQKERKKCDKEQIHCEK